jgi:hypothetical protein
MAISGDQLTFVFSATRSRRRCSCLVSAVRYPPLCPPRAAEDRGQRRSRGERSRPAAYPGRDRHDAGGRTGWLATHLSYRCRAQGRDFSRSWCALSSSVLTATRPERWRRRRPVKPIHARGWRFELCARSHHTRTSMPNSWPGRAWGCNHDGNPHPRPVWAGGVLSPNRRRTADRLGHPVSVARSRHDQAAGMGLRALDPARAPPCRRSAGRRW